MVRQFYIVRYQPMWDKILLFDDLQAIREKLRICYDKDMFENFQFMISDVRVIYATRLEEYWTNIILVKQAIAEFTDKNKNTTDLKSDNKCKNKFKALFPKRVIGYKVQEIELKALDQRLKALVEQREAIKTKRIDQLSEDKNMR